MYKNHVVLILTFLILILVFPVSAKHERISATTEEIDLLAGIKIKISCSTNAYLTPPTESLKAEQSSIWYLKTESGIYYIDIYLPSPIDQWYSKQINQITSDYDFSYQIVPGLEITLTPHPFASLSITGPASLQTSSISWENYNYDTKPVIVDCQKGATGATITVNADFSLAFTVSLNINMLLFSQEITNYQIAQIPLTPTISESKTVPHSFMEQVLNFIFSPLVLLGIMTILLIIFLAGIFHMGKKRQKMKQRTTIKPQKEEPKTLTAPQQKRLKYCIYCGEKLSPEATYCGNCGKKIK